MAALANSLFCSSLCPVGSGVWVGVSVGGGVKVRVGVEVGCVAVAVATGVREGGISVGVEVGRVAVAVAVGVAVGGIAVGVWVCEGLDVSVAVSLSVPVGMGDVRESAASSAGVLSPAGAAGNAEIIMAASRETPAMATRPITMTLGQSSCLDM